jgi:L-seryl-tRNA(Ser) seleniumtransferase
VEDILIELTGAESAMVVNNNAAAVLITLDTIAKDKEVIISRGQLVEIGGSFRIPEVMRKSGARMFEIGTTNKTTIDDYYNLPVMEDLGSGCFIDFSLYGLTKEPTVQDSVAKGADIITFSGDKMLGGPQCGIILGKEKIISAIKANQLARALRVDKLTLFALQETLSLYRDEKKAIQQIPTLRMICQSYQSVCRRAKKLLNMIGRVDNTNISLRLCDGFSRVGGGAMPLEEIRSRILCISPGRLSAPYIVNLLHSYNPPIIARLEKDQVLLDVRTIQEKEVKIVAEAIKLLSATNAIS